MESIKQIAERVKGLREILEISVKEMAELCHMTEKDYKSYENGEKDFTFTFLNTCANRFKIDLAELLTGENAHLISYAVERKGEGLSVVRRSGFDYRHLASRFQNRMLEPYMVTVPFVEDLQNREIKTSMHAGQEMDFVMEGALKVTVNGRIETLNAGDCIIYDSSKPHGMIAVDGKECKFLAILINK